MPVSRVAHLTIALLVAVVSVNSLSAEDWPQWLGPQRDSVWRESGILKKFPAEGPKLKWKSPVGLGYSGPSVSEGRVFVPDYQKASGKIQNTPGGPDILTGTERLLCLDERTGDTLWEYAYEQPYKVSYGAGPRCTPTVDGDNVYFLGAEGKLACLAAKSGEVIWKHDLNKEYGAQTPMWGHSAHPLVNGDVLYCLVGGSGSVAVAFDKNSGKEIWKSLDAKEQGYCPPTMIEHDGTKQLLIWEPSTLHSLNPQSGEEFWSLPIQPQYGMSVTAPRYHNGQLFVTGIGSVSTTLKLSDGNSGAEVVWNGTPKSGAYCCNSTPFVEGDTIYGCDIGSGALVAASLKDGERLWQTTAPTNGSPRGDAHATVFLVKQDNSFFLMSEQGDLIIANLSPTGYEELDRAHLLEPTNSAFGRQVVWSHPAFANRCIFARNDQEIVCYDLSSN